ncbi:MAG: hypothetical protein J0H31_01865 [Alphaproteobacteria bacterium]|nr:hypothetical protein [Alphaproteobacteria bacterium]
MLVALGPSDPNAKNIEAGRSGFLTMEHVVLGKKDVPFGRMLEQQFKSPFSAKFLQPDSNIIRLSE